MPSEERRSTTFFSWKAGEDFDVLTGRLLVTTERGDTFVVCSGPPEDDGLTYVIDQNFLPGNLVDIPKLLIQRRTLPFHWDASAHPWEIFVFDAKPDSPDSCIQMFAAGAGRWELTIFVSFVVVNIEAVQLKDIDPSKVSRELDGVHFGEYTFDEELLYQEAIRLLEAAYKST